MSSRRAAFALFAMIIAVVVAVLLFEGAWSMATGRSFLRRRIDAGRSLLEAMQQTDEERRQTGLLTEGPYRVGLDPWIAMEMKAGFSGTFHRAPFSTDESGRRRRTGPPPEDGAPRIVVLGDSIAFGFGVEDHETIGARLEEELGRATVRGRPRPVVFTLATPGWNAVNEHRRIVDDLEDLDPDVVIQIIVGNDFDDGLTTLESGHRAFDRDIVAGVDRRPAASLQNNLAFLGALGLEKRSEWLEQLGRIPTYSLYSFVTPESRRRTDRLIADAEDLASMLDQRGAKLLVVAADAAAVFERRMIFEFRVRGSPVETAFIFERSDKATQLADDPHLNAAASAEAARRLAQHILRAGWIDGAADAVSVADPIFEANVAKFPGLDAMRAEIARHEEHEHRELGAVIDLSDGRGAHQVYGGVLPDGRVGPRSWFAVKARGGETAVELIVDTLPTKNGRFEQDLELRFGDSVVDTVRISGEGPRAVRFALPRRLDEGEIVEPIFAARLWRRGVYRRIPILEALRLTRVALVP